LLSLGNVLSLRGDNYAAQSYYTDLLNTLNVRHADEKSLQPQGNKDDFDLVDKFLKVNNNLGVTLYRIAEQTGDSNKHGQAITRLQDSLRECDALTRNQKTM
ncbi:MAG: hypothetical protein J6Y93_03675, partial [Treponema sp.]|nr:hypothetical protein [Treponema sp.]